MDEQNSADQNIPEDSQQNQRNTEGQIFFAEGEARVSKNAAGPQAPLPTNEDPAEIQEDLDELFAEKDAEELPESAQEVLLAQADTEQADAVAVDEDASTESSDGESSDGGPDAGSEAMGGAQIGLVGLLAVGALALDDSDDDDSAAADDIITGGDDDDTITGGDGDDTITGGVENTYISSLGDDKYIATSGEVATFNYVQAAHSSWSGDENAGDTFDFADDGDDPASATINFVGADFADASKDRATGDIKPGALVVDSNPSESESDFFEASDGQKLAPNQGEASEASEGDQYSFVYFGSGANPTEYDVYVDVNGNGNLGDEDMHINLIGSTQVTTVFDVDDTITGGEGADTLTGGAGDDTFVFDGSVSSADVGNDITDFNDAGVDDIDFTTNAATGTGITAGDFQAATVETADGDVAAEGGFAFVTDAENNNTAASLGDTGVAAFLADLDGAGNSSFEFANADNVLYLAVTDGTDTGVFLADDQNGDTVIDADDLTQIVELTGVTTVDADDFADFAV